MTYEEVLREMDCNKTVTKSGTPIKLLLGSLFDGSGGFPLGGLLSGITPVWASEIEPFPIRVTTKRLPFMKHYGDISAMDGSKIEPVDIITFGSPCTDMSVAGKRAGLEGHQSVLFYEAIRIIKEMREATNGVYPRFIVWENVPGAFSSNKGEDFRSVLEEVCKIKDECVSVPKPSKWQSAGKILGDGYSVAWRQLDAQFWGVPQRRKRIYLVADFAGWSAGKILFESEGLSGYSAEGFRSWQRTALNVKDGIGATGFDGYNGALTGNQASTLGVNCGMSTGRAGVIAFEPGATKRIGSHAWVDQSGTLRADMGDNQIAVAVENHPNDSRVKIRDDGKVQSLTSRKGTGGGNVPLVMKIRSGCEGGGKGALIQENKSATLSCNNDQTLFEPCSWDGGQTVSTLTAHNAGGNQRMLDKNHFNCVIQAYGICSKDSNAMKSTNPYSGIYEAETSRTLDGNGRDPGAIQSGYTVRRLTPTECARLQGFPDWWCDDLGIAEPTDEDVAEWREIFDTHAKALGKETKPKTDAQIRKWLINPHSDSAEYKMWGNGVALPCVFFVLSGIVYYSQNDEETKGDKQNEDSFRRWSF